MINRLLILASLTLFIQCRSEPKIRFEKISDTQVLELSNATLVFRPDSVFRPTNLTVIDSTIFFLSSITQEMGFINKQEQIFKKPIIEGKGPGEFDLSGSINITSCNETIAIWDWSQARIQLYDKLLSLKKIISTEGVPLHVNCNQNNWLVSYSNSSNVDVLRSNGSVITSKSANVNPFDPEMPLARRVISKNALYSFYILYPTVVKETGGKASVFEFNKHESAFGQSMLLSISTTQDSLFAYYGLRQADKKRRFIVHFNSTREKPSLLHISNDFHQMLFLPGNRILASTDSTHSLILYNYEIRND
jgi:hypothetical protein